LCGIVFAVIAVINILELLSSTLDPFVHANFWLIVGILNPAPLLDDE
jgi:hypothetical protein